jgi:hypothetical protein
MTRFDACAQPSLAAEVDQSQGSATTQSQNQIASTRSRRGLAQPTLPRVQIEDVALLTIARKWDVPRAAPRTTSVQTLHAEIPRERQQPRPTRRSPHNYPVATPHVSVALAPSPHPPRIAEAEASVEDAT